MAYSHHWTGHPEKPEGKNVGATWCYKPNEPNRHLWYIPPKHKRVCPDHFSSFLCNNF